VNIFHLQDVGYIARKVGHSVRVFPPASFQEHLWDKLCANSTDKQNHFPSFPENPQPTTLCYRANSSNCQVTLGHACHRSRSQCIFGGIY
jgi:hypothetical protein